MTPEADGLPRRELVAVKDWRTNGQLIADVAQLHLSRHMIACDPTYGRGLWWTEWHPDTLIASDLEDKHGPGGECEGQPRPGNPQFTAPVDFTATGHGHGVFDLVAYDPPYVPPGGRDTSTIDDFHARYGMRTTPTTPKALTELITAGFVEAVRITDLGGLVLAKCMDYVWGGRQHETTRHLGNVADKLGVRLVDKYIMYTPNPRPQPGGRVQRTARRNASTLFVYRLPKRRTTR